MKIKPKIEPLDLTKFLKEKSKQFDLPVAQLEEIASYARRCYIFDKINQMNKKRNPKYSSPEFMKSISQKGVKARIIANKSKKKLSTG